MKKIMMTMSIREREKSNNNNNNNMQRISQNFLTPKYRSGLHLCEDKIELNDVDLVISG